MSNVWPVVTKSNPCPICGKQDWCAIGDRAIKCMRVESDHACESGGWYHITSGAASAPRLRPLPPKRPSMKINCASLINSWMASTTTERCQRLADSLGVTLRALSALRATWAPQYDAWAFPMRDGSGNTVGIRLRAEDGRKWTVKDTHSGIFVDTEDNYNKAWIGKTAFICEGPTDTAACLSIGLKVIGKPSCSACNEFVIEALKRLRPREVVILADMDSKINPKTGKPFNTGLIEARKLKDKLNFRTLICPPPSGLKDVREFVNLGGQAVDIEAMIRQLLWV